MNSISFDRAAGFYDQTRGMPPDATTQMASLAIDLIGPNATTRVVEIGVGTGRIAKPLIANDIRLVGVDVSRSMMSLVQQEMPNAKLINGDVTCLPLASACADAVIAVHILHLVHDWHATLAEARRIMRTDGVFLLGRNRHLPNIIQNMRDYLYAFLDTRGVQMRRTGRVTIEDEVEAVLLASGAQVETVETPSWSKHITLAEDIRGIEQRLWSHLWSVSDDALADAVTALQRHALEHYGSLDVEVETQQTFVWKAFRWQS